MASNGLHQTNTGSSRRPQETNNWIAADSVTANTMQVEGRDIAQYIESKIQESLSKFGLTETELNKASEQIAQTAMKKNENLPAKQAGGNTLERAVMEEAVDKAINAVKKRFMEKDGIMELVKKCATHKTKSTHANLGPSPNMAKAEGPPSYAVNKEILNAMYTTAVEIYWG